MPSKISVDQIAHSNETNALEIDTSGNVTIQQDLKFAGNAALKDSAGNNVISESAGVITVNADAAVISGSSTGDLMRITQTGAGNALVVEDSANPDSTPFVVDASGNVGIGTTPSQKLEVLVNETTGSKIYTKLDGTSNNFTNLVIDSSEDFDDSRAVLYFYHDSTPSAYVGTNYRTSDGAADYLQLRTLETDQDIVLTATGEITASTAGSERMRIDSNGHILLNGKTSADNTSQVGAVFYVNGSNGTTVNSPSSGFFTFHLYNQNATFNGYRFYVGVNGGIANYQANDTNLSDERLKTNIQLSENYLSKICAIPVKRFNYKDEPEGKPSSLGVIAQDVETVAPELICLDGFEGLDFDGDPVKTVYTTDMMYALMKSIQEQQALIESQQSQINALTARIEALESN